ncbi:MAG: hypothetical protein ABIP03_03910 [Aquihabitans sp.]
MRLAFRLGWTDARGHPVATAASAATGLVGSLVLTTVPAHSGPVGPRDLTLLALIAVPGAVAAGTDPAQRNHAEVLVRMGAAKWLIRMAAVVAAAGPAALGALVGAVAGGLWRSGRSPAADPTVTAMLGLLLPVCGALLTAEGRLPGSELVSRSSRSLRLPTLSVRTALGITLVGLGAAVPVLSTSGSDLDLLLPLGTALVIAGLTLAGPAFLGIAATAVARLPGSSPRVAAGVLHRNRRALTLPVALTSAAACVLAVQGILGVGLGQREANRVDAVSELGPATVGTSPRQLLFEGVGLFEWYEDHPTAGPNGPNEARPPTNQEQVTAARAALHRLAPDHRAATIDAAPYTATIGDPKFGENFSTSPFSQFGRARPTVAVATPELLGVLGLDPAWADEDLAIALDPRVLRPDRSVHLVGLENDSSRPEPRTLPARLAGRRGVPAGLPAVLVPRSMLQNPTFEPSVSLLARFPTRPSDHLVGALTKSLGQAPRRGDAPLAGAKGNRSDQMSSVWVRTNTEVWGLLLPLVLAALVINWIAQAGVALAHRHEDEVLDVLGAGRPMRWRLGAVRGLVLGLTGTVVGAAVGGGATVLGLTRYNRRLNHDPFAQLTAIPISMPISVVAGLAALVIVSTAVGAILAATRRQSATTTRAERLAW